MVLSALLVAGLCACSAPEPLTEGELFDQANAEFENGDFNLATIHYTKLLEEYPFSDEAEAARLRIAHAYYLSRRFDKAVESFNEFERLHPTSVHLPFVEYTIGMSFLDKERPSDRDKSASEHALLQFEQVKTRYAGTLYGRLASYRISECRENLAAHELEVAEYYAREERTEAGLQRLRFLIDKYPETDAATTAKRIIKRGEFITADSDAQEELVSR